MEHCKTQSRFRLIQIRVRKSYWLFRLIEKDNSKIVINFAPTNRFPAQRLSSKGYNEILPILNRLKEEYKDKIEVLLYWNKSQEEDLMLKQKKLKFDFFRYQCSVEKWNLWYYQYIYLLILNMILPFIFIFLYYIWCYYECN